MGDLDRALKHLLKEFPTESCQLFLPQFPGLRVLDRLERTVDKEIEFSTRVSDKVFKVLLPSPVSQDGRVEPDKVILLHFEPVVSVRAESFRGALLNASALYYTYATPVYTVLLALKEDEYQAADRHAQLSWKVADEERMQYRIELIKLWCYDAEDALVADNPVGWLLAPLMAGGATEAVLAAGLARVEGLTALAEPQRESLISVWAVIGYHQVGENIRRLIGREGMLEMLESPAFKDVADEFVQRRLKAVVERMEEQERKRAEEAQGRLETERKRAEEAQSRLETERKRAEEAQIRLKAERKGREDERKRAEEERKGREEERKGREEERKGREEEHVGRELEHQARLGDLRQVIERLLTLHLGPLDPGVHRRLRNETRLERLEDWCSAACRMTAAPDARRLCEGILEDG